MSKFFVEKQYVHDGGLLLKFSEEEMRQWEEALLQDRLTVDDYNILLPLWCWELGFIPFILNGLKVFKISLGDCEGDEPNLPPSSNRVIPVFLKAWEAIQQGNLLVEKSNRSVQISISEAIHRPRSVVSNKLINEFCNNAGDFCTEIKSSKVIEWAILNNIQMDKTLLTLLSLYQDPPIEELCEETIGNRTYRKKIIKESKVTNPEKYEVEYLAAAQMLWSQYKRRNKSQIASNLLMREFGPPGGYSKEGGNILKKLSIIDPFEQKKGRGRRPKPEEKEFALLPIPGIVIQEDGNRKIDLKRSKVAFFAFIQMLKKIIPLVIQNFDA